MKKSAYLIFFLFTIACKKDLAPVVYTGNNNIVAHRGAWRDDRLPQNSIASLRRAIEMKCIGSECDVWLTKDDSLVVEHDIQYGGKTVENNTYETLAKKKLSNGEMLPTLRQYLLAIEGQDQTKLFIELKSMSFKPEKLNKVSDRISDLVNGMQLQDHVIYTSFFETMLKRVRQRYPSAKTLFLGGTLSPSSIQSAGMSGICYDIDSLSKHPDWMLLAKTDNLILGSWIVNNDDQFSWLLNNNADYVMTDVPNELFRKLMK